MKQYKYKIKWLLKVNKDYKFNNEIKQLLNIVGAKSLDKIVLRDNDLNIIDSYNGFIMFPYGLGEVEVLKYIKKEVKKNDNIFYIEFVRT